MNWWVIYPDRAVSYGQNVSNNHCRRSEFLPVADDKLLVFLHDDQVDSALQEEALLSIKDSNLSFVGVTSNKETLHRRVSREDICFTKDGYFEYAPFQRDLLNRQLKLYGKYSDKGDYGQALSLLKRLAAVDEPLAMFLLGDMYAKGEGVEVSLSEAEKWYVRAVNTTTDEFGVEMLGLGLQFYWGDRVEKSYEKAIAWFKRSSSLGNAEAAFSMAVYHMDVTKDFKTALEWLEVSGNRGFVEAQIFAGILLGYSKHGIASRDIPKGRFWCKRALYNKSATEKQRQRATECLRLITFYKKRGYYD
jgi:TPR repeat protein